MIIKRPPGRQMFSKDCAAVFSEYKINFLTGVWQ